MTTKRLFFTGGSGKAGKHVIPYLLEQGHKVLNVDLMPLNHPGVDNLVADITDSGQMFNALSSYAGLDELEPGQGVVWRNWESHWLGLKKEYVTSKVRSPQPRWI